MLKRSVVYQGQRYEVLLEEEGDGGYSVSAPAVPGAYSDGDTEAEALENIVDAIAMLRQSALDVAEILLAQNNRRQPGSGANAPPPEREVATD